MTLPDGAGVILAGALGLVFGSFANVCIHRIPAGESIVAPRSRCPRCRAPIRWHDNLPLLSWLLLRGRCRACGYPIAWSYPLVEAVMAAGFVAAWASFGITLEGAAAAWLFFTCVSLFAIDSRHFILPDILTLTGIGAGLAFALLRGVALLPSAGEAFSAAFLLGGPLDLPPLAAASLAGAAAGAAIPLLARLGYRMFRALRGAPSSDPGGAGDPEADRTAREEDEAGRAGEDGGDDVAAAALEEGMGLGDVKMLAMVGSFLGPRAVLVTILAGSISGCLVVIPWMLATRRGFRTPIPFGPFLAFGAILALFAGGPLAEGYERLLFRILG